MFSAFDMDIGSYFGSPVNHQHHINQCWSVLDSSSSSSDDEEGAVPPTKKCHISTREPSKKYRTPSSSIKKCQKKWEKYFTWLQYDADCDGAFCKLCKTYRRSLKRIGG